MTLFAGVHGTDRDDAELESLVLGADVSEEGKLRTVGRPVRGTVDVAITVARVFGFVARLAGRGVEGGDVGVFIACAEGVVESSVEVEAERHHAPDVALDLDRRAERLTVELATMEQVNPAAVKYLNRLSDWFFVAARIANNNGKDDVLWVPGANR